MYYLFLDDERYPVPPWVPDLSLDWRIVRNFDDAVWHVRTFGLPTHMSLDHDLGANARTGMDFVKWLCDHIIDNDLKPDFDYAIHSRNPIGAQNMDSYLQNFKRNY